VTDQPGSIPKHCEGTRKDGQPCTAPVLGAGTWCFAHDPERGAQRQAARERGGKHRGSVVRLRGLCSPKLIEVYEQLEQALGEVHEGKLAASQGVAMASLARAMVAVLSAGELEERVRRLEGRAS
jgi:hypothetical protein